MNINIYPKDGKKFKYEELRNLIFKTIQDTITHNNRSDNNIISILKCMGINLDGGVEYYNSLVIEQYNSYEDDLDFCAIEMYCHFKKGSDQNKPISTFTPIVASMDPDKINEVKEISAIVSRSILSYQSICEEDGLKFSITYEAEYNNDDDDLKSIMKSLNKEGIENITLIPVERIDIKDMDNISDEIYEIISNNNYSYIDVFFMLYEPAIVQIMRIQIMKGHYYDINNNDTVIGPYMVNSINILGTSNTVISLDKESFKKIFDSLVEQIYSIYRSETDKPLVKVIYSPFTLPFDQSGGDIRLI